MWVFTKDGFLSAVQHDDDRSRMRIRARKREHLDNAFPDYEILDMREDDDQHDYRWHLDIARGEWVDYLMDAAMDIDYTSHVKEAIAKNDQEFYRVLLRVWSVMHELQEGKQPVDELVWDDDDSW